MAMVTVTPTVVHIRTIVTMVMVTNAGPTALLPTGISDRATIKAHTANPQALLIPATPPQLLESASSISLVWGTITVMLTSMVVPSTIAGGPYTNIRIRVEMTEYPPVSSRVRDRIARVCAKNILARASISTCRVSTLSLPRRAKSGDFSFHLINPRRLPRAASSDSNSQTAAWAHLPHAVPQAPSVSHGQEPPVCLFPCADCI
ncbi:hypothetical protein EDB83DRAFT_1711465 [Lactarius deliciosus]|nr:hypothetical protein EDB83DRAFT_1711465 [Lactarius deliciosus]